tara:strand:- start:6605 stop:7216 length:612 start_codon:yes stop_codon:yes gene_type:complete
MKTLKIVILSLVSVVLMNSSTYQKNELKIGSKAPMIDHKMDDISGRSLTLGEVAQENGLLVIFSCNTCPWVIKWEDRYPDISRMAKANKVGMVALNPNEDYRNKGDGMEDMVKHAKKAGYDFPYVLDKNHLVADAFGASRTPHVYLFNSEMVLVYVGAIDDNANSATAVKDYYIKDAMEQMVEGKNLTRPNTKSLGCTIKRIS